MKVGPLPGNARGSMGIPPDLQEQAQKARDERDRKLGADAKRQEQEREGPSESWPLNEDAQTDAPESAENPEAKPEEQKPLDPLEMLKKIGVTPTEDDFYNFIFKGYIEKTLELVKSSIAGVSLTVTLRTLTAQELDFVDELVAEDLDNIKMTNQGIAIRRSMWTLAFALHKLNGKPVIKELVEDGKPKLKENARAKRAVIQRLAPTILDMMLRTHAVMTTAFGLVINESGNDSLKK